MRSRALLALAAGGLAAAIAAGAGYDVAMGNAKTQARAAALTGGDPARGREAMRLRACGGCHQIPGVPGARGTVGPPLGGFLRRGYIAGRLPNAPDNLKLWVRAPHTVDPKTAMPETGVTPAEAADIAAYLYTLE